MYNPLERLGESPVVFLAAAGAALFAAVGLLDKGNHLRGLAHSRDKMQLQADAIEAGLDPDQALASYDDARTSDVSLGAAGKMLGRS